MESTVYFLIEIKTKRGARYFAGPKNPPTDNLGHAWLYERQDRAQEVINMLGSHNREFAKVARVVTLDEVAQP